MLLEEDKVYLFKPFLSQLIFTPSNLRQVKMRTENGHVNSP